MERMIRRCPDAGEPQGIPEVACHKPDRAVVVVVIDSGEGSVRPLGCDELERLLL